MDNELQELRQETNSPISEGLLRDLINKTIDGAINTARLTSVVSYAISVLKSGNSYVDAKTILTIAGVEPPVDEKED